jgi:hypothetical protein
MNLMGHGIIRSHGPFVCFTPTRQVVRLPSVVYLAPHTNQDFVELLSSYRSYTISKVILSLTCFGNSTYFMLNDFD